jgi:DNA-directed RNA polymerase specialized sigma24 family protein
MNLQPRLEFTELLDDHRRLVLKVANTYARATADIEDLAQEIAAQLAPPLLHHWARRRNSRLAAWLDDFLLSRSIARAKATIAEIDEFSRA